MKINQHRRSLACKKERRKENKQYRAEQKRLLEMADDVIRSISQRPAAMISSLQTVGRASLHGHIMQHNIPYITHPKRPSKYVPRHRKQLMLKVRKRIREMSSEQALKDYQFILEDESHTGEGHLFAGGKTVSIWQQSKMRLLLRYHPWLPAKFEKLKLYL